MACGLNDTCTLFTLEKGKLTKGKEIQANFEEGEFGYVKTLEFSPSGNQIATGGTDGIVRVWRSPGLAEEVLLKGTKAEINSVSFDSEGDLVGFSFFFCFFLPLLSSFSPFFWFLNVEISALDLMGKLQLLASTNQGLRVWKWKKQELVCTIEEKHVSHGGPFTFRSAA